MTEDLSALSRFLSYVLRHHPEAIGITLDEGGWVDVDALLAALAARDRPTSREALERVAAGTDKQRLQLRDGRVRAAQGHTVPVTLGLAPLTPPALLYHGTVSRFLPSIVETGLRPRGRHHVHLSADPQTAATVGARRGHPVVLRIDAAGMHHHGHLFFQAANGVWLTAHVPARWLRLASDTHDTR